MKLTYPLIVGFFVWCFVASQWYLLGLKGVKADLQANTQQATMAIIEISIMLLVAVLIGFAIAWYQRQASIDRIKRSVSVSLEEKKHHEKQISETIERLHNSEARLAATQTEYKVDVQRAVEENQKLKAALKEKDETIAILKEEFQSVRPKVQLADVELGRYSIQIKQLEAQLANEKMITNGLKQELEQLHTPKRKQVEVAFDKVQEKNKDDLKMISGIGPVIEAKLNDIGIFTFKQISEFTPQTIDYVTSSIKFFPDRIGRDNWIGQAAALVRYRK
jgi:predicted flap endonuclease-1-like 5' DNA nuclease